MSIGIDFRTRCLSDPSRDNKRGVHVEIYIGQTPKQRCFWPKLAGTALENLPARWHSEIRAAKRTNGRCTTKCKALRCDDRIGRKPAEIPRTVRRSCDRLESSGDPWCSLHSQNCTADR